MKYIIALFMLVTGGFGQAAHAVDLSTFDKEDLLYLDIEPGRVTILMFPKIAPNHVARIRELARQGFYEGTIFHRVIPGFMAQGGDPTGTGRGGSGKHLQAEFSKTPHLRGTVSMARAETEDSADSQFFIVFDRSPFLDSKYTIWGRVIDGMQYVDELAVGEPPANPTKILKVTVASDE